MDWSIKQVLNTDIGKPAKPVEANQICIKKPKPDTQVKFSKLGEKRTILASIRKQVGIL